MTNWKAMQVPHDKTTKEPMIPSDVLPKGLSMGSFHADVRKDGRSRKVYKCTREFSKEKK